MTIAITHTMADGTLVDGDPRPHHAIIQAAGFRYSGRCGWYVQQSRDKPPRVDLEALAERLRAVGFDVTVDIDTAARPFEEREADRAERLEARADRLDDRADRLAAVSAAAYEGVRRIADMIPLGQPILVGHHSEKRHRRDVDRIERGMHKTVETGREADETRRRAAASRAQQDARYTLPVTLRRIARLEVEQRDIGRKLASCGISGRKMKPEAAGRTVRCPHCYVELTIDETLVVPDHGGAAGEWRERLTARNAALDDELASWRQHVADLRDSGEHQWGPDDFKVGDRVNGDCVVVRVNKKTLTIRFDAFAHTSMTYTLPYSDIRTREAVAR